MTGTIYLIGGGEVRDGDTRLIDQDISSLAAEGAKLVFFPTAAEDNQDYSNVIKSTFGDQFEVEIATRKKGKKYATNAMKSASVVYLGGGQTELLLELFSEWNIKGDLVAALEGGTHIAGMSAGAQALSAYYVDEESDEHCIRKGWGLILGCVYVHANQDYLTKAKELWFNHKEASQHPFIAISEKAAWRISPQGEEKVGSGKIWISRY